MLTFSVIHEKPSENTVLVEMLFTVIKSIHSHTYIYKKSHITDVGVGVQPRVVPLAETFLILYNRKQTEILIN